MWYFLEKKYFQKKGFFYQRNIYCLTDDISIIFHFNTYDLVGQAKGLKLFSVTRKSSHMLAKYTWKIDVTFTTHQDLPIFGPRVLANGTLPIMARHNTELRGDLDDIKIYNVFVVTKKNLWKSLPSFLKTVIKTITTNKERWKDVWRSPREFNPNMFNQISQIPFLLALELCQK